MDLSIYAQAAASTAVYPRDPLPPLLYTVLGLAEEAGEVAGVVKKHIRNTPEGQAPAFHTSEFRERLAAELGDVFWYLVQVCREAGLDPEQVLVQNVEKLAARQAAGTLKNREK
jgi:NTP pyrophosphatase (non-canonical NTP hydrolase)